MFTIADAGIETVLMDRLGQELPEFAAFVLLDTEPGRHALRTYYRAFVELASDRGLPLALDTPTWRANPDWGALLGYDAVALDRVNREAVALTRGVVDEAATALDAAAPAVTVAGCIGPRFDDFNASERMSPDASEQYHGAQVRALAAAGVDRVTAVTMIDVAEPVGIVRAARAVGIPVIVSFTVDAAGLLPDGSTLGAAIDELDAATDGYAEGVFVNCAHPDEVARAFAQSGAPGEWPSARVGGFRLNAAHADTEDAAADGAEVGADGPVAYAEAFARLRRLAAAATTFGGCCGTDVPHIDALAARFSEG